MQRSAVHSNNLAMQHSVRGITAKFFGQPATHISLYEAVASLLLLIGQGNTNPTISEVIVFLNSNLAVKLNKSSPRIGLIFFPTLVVRLLIFIVEFLLHDHPIKL